MIRIIIRNIISELLLNNILSLKNQNRKLNPCGKSFTLVRLNEFLPRLSRSSCESNTIICVIYLKCITTINAIYRCNVRFFWYFWSTGKVEMITGVGKAMLQSLTQWGNPNRPIAASGIFGHYMVTPADEALFVINGETRTVNCEIGGLVHPRLVTWVTMQLQ